MVLGIACHVSDWCAGMVLILHLFLDGSWLIKFTFKLVFVLRAQSWVAYLIEHKIPTCNGNVTIHSIFKITVGTPARLLTEKSTRLWISDCGFKPHVRCRDSKK